MNYTTRNVFPPCEDNMQVSILEFPAFPPAPHGRFHVILKDLDSGQTVPCVTICKSYESALEIAKHKFLVKGSS